MNFKMQHFQIKRFYFSLRWLLSLSYQFNWIWSFQEVKIVTVIFEFFFWDGQWNSPKDGTKDSSVIESFQPIQGLYRQETEVRFTPVFLLNQHQNHANRFRWVIASLIPSVLSMSLSTPRSHPSSHSTEIATTHPRLSTTPLLSTPTNAPPPPPRTSPNRPTRRRAR